MKFELLDDRIQRGHVATAEEERQSPFAAHSTEVLLLKRLEAIETNGSGIVIDLGAARPAYRLSRLGELATAKTERRKDEIHQGVPPGRFSFSQFNHLL
jgi:hypothetical protein